MRRLITLAGAACIALLIGTGGLCPGATESRQSQRCSPRCTGSAALWRADQSRDRQRRWPPPRSQKRQKRNWNAFCIAIVNPGGDLVWFPTGYGQLPICVGRDLSSTRRARPPAIVAQRWCSKRLIGKGPYYAYLTTLDDVIASRGGNPLVINGKIIGAIGVSGGFRGLQDNVVSLVGQAALK